MDDLLNDPCTGKVGLKAKDKVLYKDMQDDMELNTVEFRNQLCLLFNEKIETCTMSGVSGLWVINFY